MAPTQLLLMFPSINGCYLEYVFHISNSLNIIAFWSLRGLHQWQMTIVQELLPWKHSAHCKLRDSMITFIFGTIFLVCP